MRGTIDGSEVFLDDDQLPAFTLSVNSVTDPGSVKGARSTTIRLTNTKELARVMGSQYLMSANFPPRTTLRIGDEGGEEFVSQIVPVAHDTFQIEAIAVGGNASWFEYAKATKIRSVDLGKTLPLTRTVQEDTWDDEESLVYFPLIDFGSLENRAATFDVGVTKLRPALRLHRLLDELMDPAGYRFVPQGRLVEVWKKWVVMDTGAKPTLGIPGPYPFDEIFSTSNPAPDGVYFIPTVDGTMDVDCVDLQIVFVTTNNDFDGAVFSIVVYDETSDTILASQEVLTTWANDSAYGGYTVSHLFEDVPVTAGHNIYVAIVTDSAEEPTPFVITNDLATVEYNLNSGAQTLKLRPSLSNPAYAVLPTELDEVYAGYPMSNARMAPDWTIEQLIKGIASVAGLVFDTVGNTINVWTDKEYFRTPNTVDEYRDWSTRTDLTRPPRLLYGEAPRSVEFKFKDDEGDKYLRRANRTIRSAKYASFKQTNEQGLQPDKTIEVPFTPSVAGTLFAGGGNTVSALVMRDTDEDYQVDNYGRGVRLFLADGLATGNWKHGGSSLTEYPLSYFSREDDVVPLPFGNANIVGDVPVGSNIQWSRMLSQMRSPRVIEIDLFIRDNEVKDFDFGMPTLVDDGSGPTWFWVQEIKQHRFGVNQPTKCVLVQIPMKEVAIPEVDQPNLTYPSQPFLCSGPGYVSFVVGSGGGGGVNMSTASGFYTVRYPNGTRSVVDSNVETLDLGPGSYCMWPSDSEGNIEVGTTTFLGLGGGINEVDMDGMESEPLWDLLVTDATDLAALEVPSIADLVQIDIQGCTVLDLLTFGSAGVLNNLQLLGNNLSQTSVDGILSTLAAGTVSGGTIDLSGGTNAAPGATGLAAIAVLAGTTMGIADTGNANVDGDYDPNGTLNGRDAYIHATNGVTEVYWTGSVWRIVAVGAILDSSDDVAQPWLATTWTLISGTASDPTITAPGRGWTVTTN